MKESDNKYLFPKGTERRLVSTTCTISWEFSLETGKAHNLGYGYALWIFILIYYFFPISVCELSKYVLTDKVCKYILAKESLIRTMTSEDTWTVLLSLRGTGWGEKVVQIKY